MSGAGLGTRRIALVIRGLAGRMGGAERLYCEMAGMFAAAGHGVTCVHVDASDAPPFYPLADGVERVNLWRPARDRGLATRAIDRLGRVAPPRSLGAPFHWLGRNLHLTRALAAHLRTRRPDLVISFMPPANTPSLIAGRLVGVPVIPTNHNVPEEDYRSTERWDQNPIDRALRLRLLWSAARIHVLFPDFAAWFPAALRPRIVAIPNYVSPEFVGLPLPATRPPVVLSVGRLSAAKDHAALIEAWATVAARHPDWRLRICGEGPERGALEATIVRHGLAASVELAGATGEVRREYLGAAILAHPARFEGFGLAVAEGLACGLPVVAFADRPGTRELLRDGDNAVLADRAGGPAALAAALDRLIADPPLRARLAARAPASIEPFSLAAYRARWLALVDDVLAARPPADPRSDRA